MNEHGPILVPLDGSELAENALPFATALAHSERTHLVLVTVWEDAGSVSPDVAVDLEKRGREYFDSYLNRVRDKLQQPGIRTMVLCGNAGEEILKAAHEVDARVIVAASHGRSGVSRWLYGSTANHLLHDSTLPVLIVGPKAQPVAVGTAAAIRNIMLPLDGSDVSESAIPTAIRIARECGAKLNLVRAIGWAVETYPYAATATYLPVLDTDLEEGGRNYLAQQLQAVSSQVSAEAFVVRGATAPSLLAFAEENAIDLVIMTTHARRGLARTALGSVAERMLHATAPVLLLRPHATAREGAPGDRLEERAVKS